MNNRNLHAQSATKQYNCHSNPKLNHRVLATAKIGQILPILAIPCVPGDTFHVRSTNFTRTLPLKVPAYANLTYRTLAVFCPYHQVMRNSDGFFDNMEYTRGLSTKNILSIRIRDIFAMLAMDGKYCTRMATDQDNTADFQFTENNVGFFCKLTALGHYAAKVLQLLGYNYPFVRDPQYGAAPEELTTKTKKLNALPILAFAHSYNTYMSYAPAYNQSELSKIIEQCAHGISSSIQSDDLDSIISSILLTYEDSFFTTAWANANSSNPNSLLQLNQNTTPVDINYLMENILHLDGSDGATLNIRDGELLSAAQTRMLLRMDSYLRRSNFSGSKDIEQIYSRFGIKIEDYMCRYPHYIKEGYSEVQIGDVTSMADTDGAVVGSYAGKAICSDTLDFKYRAQDYGMLFVFAWYAPQPIYFEGVDKEVLRVDPLDFYTPELDDGTSAAIDYSQYDSREYQEQTFGYVPLYSEYLYQPDRIVGDYRRFAEMKAWHFGRSLFLDEVAQSDNLIYMPNSGTEFERIFNISDPTLLDVDTIFPTIVNMVDSTRQMKDYSGKASLGEGDLNLPSNGSVVN